MSREYQSVRPVGASRSVNVGWQTATGPERQASNNKTVSTYLEAADEPGGRHAEGITPWPVSRP
jgi:hypothetical protein